LVCFSLNKSNNLKVAYIILIERRH